MSRIGSLFVQGRRPPDFTAQPPANNPEVNAAGALEGLVGPLPPAQPFEKLANEQGPGPGGAAPAERDTFWADEQKSSRFYNRYEVAVHVHVHTGLYGMPEAKGKEGRTHIVRPHSPTATLTIAWLAERRAAKPVLPHWRLSDPNLVLQERDILPEAAAPAPNGRDYIFRVRGWFSYLMQYAPDDDSPVLLPKLVVVTTPVTEFTLGPEQFDRTLLDGVLSAPWASPEEVDF